MYHGGNIDFRREDPQTDKKSITTIYGMKNVDYPPTKLDQIRFRTPSFPGRIDIVSFEEILEECVEFVV